MSKLVKEADLKSAGEILEGSTPSAAIYKEIRLSRVWQRHAKVSEIRNIIFTIYQEAQNLGLIVFYERSSNSDEDIYFLKKKEICQSE